MVIKFYSAGTSIGYDTVTKNLTIILMDGSCIKAKANDLFIDANNGNVSEADKEKIRSEFKKKFTGPNFVG